MKTYNEAVAFANGLREVAVKHYPIVIGIISLFSNDVFQERRLMPQDLRQSGTGKALRLPIK